MMCMCNFFVFNQAFEFGNYLDRSYSSGGRSKGHLTSTAKFDSLNEVSEALRLACPTVRAMMSECFKLCQLILCVPSSVASSERSFSALRRLKNYLRATMGQARLTHLMILHIHKSETDNLDKKNILHEFVKRKTDRINVFGAICLWSKMLVLGFTFSNSENRNRGTCYKGDHIVIITTSDSRAIFRTTLGIFSRVSVTTDLNKDNS